jgi:hypothetical protein
LALQAMGAFSVMQRIGHQSDMQAQLIVLEAVAYMVVPVLIGILEECVRRFTSFSFVMMLLGATLVWVMQSYEALMQFTDRVVLKGIAAGGAQGGAATSSLMVLDNVHVRRFFTLIAAFLTLGGFVTFMISALGGRV